jgi:general secretion pathway protein J
MKRPHQDGFTLLELLLAITIFSVLIAIVVQAFWLGSRSVEHGKTVMESELRLRSVMTLISKQIRSTFPLVTKESKRARGVYRFTGDTRSISFVTTLPLGYQQHGGLFHVNYFLEEEFGEAVKALKVMQRPIYGEEPFDLGSREDAITLIADFVDASWSYSSEGVWSDEWDAENHDNEDNPFPERVKLALHYRDGTKVQALESTIPILAQFKEPVNSKRIKARAQQ